MITNVIKKEGDKFVLFTKDGSRKLGTHPTREGAVKQEEAIKASEARRVGGSDHNSDHPVKKKKGTSFHDK